MAPFSNPLCDTDCVLNPHRQQRDSRHYSGLSSGSKIFSFIHEPFLQVKNSYSFGRDVIKKKVLKGTNFRYKAARSEGLKHSRTNTIGKVFVRSSVNFYIPFPQQGNDRNPKLTNACVCVCAFCFLRELSCLMLHLTYLSTVFLLPSLFTSFTIQSLVPHVCAIFYFLPSSSLYLSFINLIPHSHLLVISVLSFGFILSLSTDGRILHIPFCN